MRGAPTMPIDTIGTPRCSEVIDVKICFFTMKQTDGRNKCMALDTDERYRRNY